MARQNNSHMDLARVSFIRRVFVFEKSLRNARRGFLDNSRGQISPIETNKVPSRISHGANTKIEAESEPVTR